VEVSSSERLPKFAIGSLAYGFQSVSLPSVSAEAQSFSQINDYYSNYYYTNFSVEPISMARGVRAFDSSFYRWMIRSLRGEDRVQRDFLLLHFYANVGIVDATNGDVAAIAAAAAIAGGFAGAAAGNFTVAAAGASVAAGVGLGNLEMINMVGKAYMLYGCLPTRYKAGTDLDATSGDASIAELEMQPHHFTEISLDPLQLTDI
jgi:hypothetical protein